MSRSRIGHSLHGFLLAVILASLIGYIYERVHRASKQDRMELAFHSARAGWWILDVRANRLEWSDGMFELYAQKPETWEPSYEGFINSVHPEDREQVTSLLKKCYDDGVPYRAGFRVVWPDGQIHKILASGERLHDGKFIVGINVEDSVVRVYE